MKKANQTKRSLLSSALALLICFSMLLGSTFAWFTDTASTGVNTIQAGNLKVELVDEQENNLEGKTLGFVRNASGAQSDILWEPGCTYELEPVYVKNCGNLALKYVVSVSGIDGDAKLAEAIEWNVTFGNGVEGAAAVLGENNVLLPGEKSQRIVVVGHMKEDAGNEYQGLSLEGIAITVYATQATAEYDSYGNQYDANATLPSVWDGSVGEVPELVNGERHITNAAEFAAVMKATTSGNSNSLYSGETLVLDCDIDFGGRTISGIGGYNDNMAFTFDGNEHTLSNFVINGIDEAHKEVQGDGSTEYRYAGLFQQFTGEVKDLTVRNATIIGNQMVGVIASNVDGNGKITNCKVYDSVVIGAKKVGAITGYVAGVGGVVTDCYAENCEVYASDVREAQSAALVGYVGSGATIDNEEPVNVNVYRGVTPVYTAEELAAAIPNGGTVVLMNNIDANNAWTTAYVFNKDLTLAGNGKTVTNLNTPLANAYGSTITVKDLTVANSNVTANSDCLGAGVILEQAQWANLYMDNCHVKNCKLTAGDTRSAALVGYWIGGGEIKDCSVENYTTDVKGAAGAIVGHRAQQTGYVADAKVTNCTVKNSSVKTIDSGWRVGIVIGTVEAGDFYVTNLTESGNVLEQVKPEGGAETNPGHPVYGRIKGSGNIVIA